MIPTRWLRVFAPVLLSLVLFVTACAPSTSRYSEVQKETTRRGAPSAVAKTAEQGATFNKFFPNPTGTYEVVPAQEKKGFAEYKLNKDGKTVAVLSVNDTSSIPTAAAKYQTSTEKVAGYPAVDQGTNTTGILVNGRYQVKVSSRDPSFTKDDRIAWLQKFDLRGLAQLKPAATATTASPKTTAPKLPKTADVPELPPVLTPAPSATTISPKTPKTADAPKSPRVLDLQPAA